jgi:methylenetetrahydrofolate dehydrogenase (NADP+)/methenyltetrahydrofolate cyclohydrolase
MALLGLERDATVTVCHSRTADLGAVTRSADVVVVAVGRPHLLKGDMIKPGAVVLDVGVNRLPSGKLAGDADFDAIVPKAAFITPVPGGVGPMTVAMLIENAVIAAERIQGG